MTSFSQEQNRPTVQRSFHWQRGVEHTLIYVGLAIGAVLVGAPFVYMFTGSFKLNADIFSYPQLPPHLYPA